MTSLSFLYRRTVVGPDRRMNSLTKKWPRITQISMLAFTRKRRMIYDQSKRSQSVNREVAVDSAYCPKKGPMYGRGFLDKWSPRDIPFGQKHPRDRRRRLGKTLVKIAA